MPYGAKGGDTPAKDRKIEKMVKAIMRQGYGKVTAIKIAKAQIAKSKGKR